MDPKDIVYVVLAGFTICGNLIAVVWFAASQKHQLSELGRGQERIMKMLFPNEDGRLQLQTVDSCATCRKSCKEEICGFMQTELTKLNDTIKRLHTRIDGLNDKTNEIYCWIPERDRNRKP